uniref:Uncharacterized protein n=1 Tax=Panagrolaimus sp. ES5 TaxID=591445 RepID=A0AC34FAR8_9BILA
MLKYFMLASFLLCFLQVPTTDATITCYVKDDKTPLINVTTCNYCGYLEVKFPTSTSANETYQYCLTEPLFYFDDGPHNFTVNTMNICQTSTDNIQTSKGLVCNTNNCNDKCVNGAFALNFSIFAIFLSVLIPLKLA